MRRSTSILFLAISFLLLNCDKPNQEQKTILPLREKETIPQKEEIVLVLKNREVATNKIKAKVGFIKYNYADLLFSDRKGDVVLNIAEVSKDTLSIKLTGNYGLVRCRHNAVGYYDFLVKKGDTLQIEFKQGIPQATILNREGSNFDLNYDLHLSKYLNLDPKEFTVLEQYHHPERDITIGKISIPDQEKALRKKQYLAAIPLLAKEKHFLDSLRAKNLLSPTSYAFFHDRMVITQHQLDIKEGQLPPVEIKQLMEKMSPDKFNGINFYKEDLVNIVATKLYSDKAKRIDVGNGMLVDYRQVYDSINNSNIIPASYKPWLLMGQLEMIAEYFSNEDLKKYYKRYLSSVKDTAMINQVNKQFAFALNNKVGDTKSTHLQTTNKKEVSLENIKRQYAGKVIYIDFWASWCGPCRAAMPESFALKDKMKGEDVVFVYLSIDKTPQAWHSASAKEGLNKYKDNYLVLNPDKSDFIRKQNVRSIPRYMIFDKAGELAYANAPGPKSKELKAILLDLSKK